MMFQNTNPKTLFKKTVPKHTLTMTEAQHSKSHKITMLLYHTVDLK